MQNTQNQLDLFEQGKLLRDEAIKRAIDHAEQAQLGWQEMAFAYLCHYAKHNRRFLAEDVRNASEGIIPEPPSKRAWGGIFVKARKRGMIKPGGFQNVKNPKAHCTPATVWEAIR